MGKERAWVRPLARGQLMGADSDETLYAQWRFKVDLDRSILLTLSNAMGLSIQ